MVLRPRRGPVAPPHRAASLVSAAPRRSAATKRAVRQWYMSTLTRRGGRRLLASVGSTKAAEVAAEASRRPRAVGSSVSSRPTKAKSQLSRRCSMDRCGLKPMNQMFQSRRKW
eukprot:scaffold30372_cov38-Phaeocystis_antarctica.AAC.6